MISNSNTKRTDKSFSKEDPDSDNNINNSIVDISIASCPLVKSLRESSNIHKIQEYEENDISEQFQNQDLY
jgi:hypothetical protein